MPKNIIIASESTKIYTTKRLLEEGSKLKWSTKWINPYETALLGSGKIVQDGLYLLRTTGIRYDDFDLTCAKYYALRKFKIANSIEAVTQFRSKDAQCLFFKEYELANIPSITYRGVLTETTWEAIEKLAPSEDFILKMNRGNQGIGVNLVKGKQSLLSFLETFHAMKDQRFIIQPFIPHKKELRVFMVNHEIRAIIERTISRDDFRGNAKRSSGKLIKKIPINIQAEIVKASQLSKLNYCGIDLILTPESKNYTFSFIEINAVPGFEQIEQLTSLNIARELLLNLQ
jgi:glutathione synthase/RimK-type ligase-like ATP-grasp enzyme